MTRIGTPMSRAIRRLVAAGALLSFIGMPGGPTRAQTPPCPTPTETARVAAVVDDLDLALEDGRTLRLAGLDPARPTALHPALAEQARRALERSLVGHEVAVAILSSSADRWDRFAALVAAPAADDSDQAHAGPISRSVNETMIAEGWARIRPEAATRACLPVWLAFEGQARASGLGLWADPYYAIVEADDGRGLAERIGAMALVEGRVRLREARGRLYLDLGHGSSGLSAVLERTGAKSVARAGLDPHRWIGSLIRVRGFLDNRFGPKIDVTDPGQIEVLEPSDARQSDDRPSGPL